MNNRWLKRTAEVEQTVDGVVVVAVVPVRVHSRTGEVVLTVLAEDVMREKAKRIKAGGTE